MSPRSDQPSSAALSALVTVRWGDTTFAATHLAGEAEAVVGAAPKSLAPIPCDAAGAASVVVARVREGAVRALVPQGSVGFRERPRAIPEPVAGPSEVPLAAGEVVSFTIGHFLVTVTAEQASKAPWAALPTLASLASLRYVAVAALAHGLFMGLSAQAAFASNLENAPPDHEDLARYLASAEDRARAIEQIVTSGGAGSLGREVNDRDGNGKAGGGTRAAGAEGAMGSPDRRSGAKGRFGVTAASARSDSPPGGQGAPGAVSSAPDPASIDAAFADARSFGMLAVLASDRRRGPVSGFADAAVNGPDPFAAAGAMFATSIGEMQGAGGLGLSGVGEGGGGDGRGIGLGVIGTIGHTDGEAGLGTGGAGGPLFGGILGGSWGGSWHGGVGIGLRHIGAIQHGTPVGFDLNPGHRERPDRAQEEGEARLPPDTIRRIVRQSHGSFRACYQAALQKNPTLAGGITTRFLIGASGRVQSAKNLGADLPDPDVVTCVTRAFYGLAFPEPPGGRSVTVVYPMTFTPE